MVSLLWQWWKQRNKVNAGNGKLNTDEVVTQASRCAMEYEQFLFTEQKMRSSVQEKWQPPQGETLKNK
jgi:hypothetical protein